MRPSPRLLSSLPKPKPSPSPSPSPPRYPTDRLCIPLHPPFSLSSLLPPPSPLPRPTLLKLHALAALLPPASDADWARLAALDGLAGVMEGVRRADTGRLGRELGVGEGEVVDGRVRGEGDGEGGEEGGGGGEGLEGGRVVELAERREGRYFVVRTPEGIRGKRRAAAKQGNEGEVLRGDKSPVI